MQTRNEDPSLTVQSDRNRAEIRHILKRYRDTGIVDHLRQVDLQFRDVTEFQDYRDAMLHAKEAEAAFLRLPSKVRELFGHDHLRWLDVAHDEEKLEELRPKLEQLGLLEPVEVPAREPVTEPSPEE